MKQYMQTGLPFIVVLWTVKCLGCIKALVVIDLDFKYLTARCSHLSVEEPPSGSAACVASTHSWAVINYIYVINSVMVITFGEAFLNTFKM